MSAPPRPLETFDRPLDTRLSAEDWLRVLADEPGLLLLDRPDDRGAVVSHLAWRPRPLDPLDYVPPGIAGPPPAAFCGGWAGVLAYDLGRRFERLPTRARDEGWPDAAGGVYDAVLVVEDGGARTRLVGVLDPDRPRDPGALVADLEARARRGPPPRVDGPALDGPLVSEPTPADHAAGVGRVVDWIHAGDIFQANLARRVSGTLAVPPVEAALRLRATNPAPRACVASLGDGRWVLSSSPELLLAIEGDRAVTRPIKGTRPRTGDAAADAASRAALLASAKDAAELAMIVDLERNDLGRLARWGGVRVVEPRIVTEYATVLHTEAVVEADLRPGLTPAEVLRAVFPGGSISGAPKVRAMEIIEELEPVRRGPYTGSAGWFGADGSAHWNILIRTLAVDGDRVHFGVGGGIVADSDPAAEQEETVVKGLALARALGAPPV